MSTTINHNQAHLDFGGVAKVIGALMNPVTADPASPGVGEVWFRSDLGSFRVRGSGSTISLLSSADLSAYVAKTLYDANTVLAATTDNTPAALTLGASTVLGRRATGNIVAISYANLIADLVAIGINAATLGGSNLATVLARSSHTGTQLASTISDFATQVNALIDSATVDADTLQTYTAANLRDRATHTGLQASSTISDLTATIDARIDAILNVTGAADAVDTIAEIASALNNDPNFYTTLTGLVNAKAGKYSANVGNGSATDIVVTHNLGTTDVSVTVKLISTQQVEVVAWQSTTANTVTLYFLTAPATNTYRVTVLG